MTRFDMTNISQHNAAKAAAARPDDADKSSREDGAGTKFGTIFDRQQPSVKKASALSVGNPLPPDELLSGKILPPTRLPSLKPPVGPLTGAREQTDVINPEVETYLDTLQQQTGLIPAVDIIGHVTLPTDIVAKHQANKSSEHLSDAQLQRFAEHLGMDKFVAQAVLKATEKSPKVEATEVAELPQRQQITASDMTPRLQDTDLVKIGQTAGVQPQMAASLFTAQQYLQSRIKPLAYQTSAQQSGQLSVIENRFIEVDDGLVQWLDKLALGTRNRVAEVPQSLAQSGADLKHMAPSVYISQPDATAGDAPETGFSSRLQQSLMADPALQQATRQMQQQLGQQLQKMVADGNWQALLTLNPSRLGRIQIHMAMENNTLHMQLGTPHQGVRELLETGLPQLQDELAHTGIGPIVLTVGDESAQQHENSEPKSQPSETGATADEPVADGAGPPSTPDGVVDTYV